MRPIEVWKQVAGQRIVGMEVIRGSLHRGGSQEQSGLRLSLENGATLEIDAAGDGDYDDYHVIVEMVVYTYPGDINQDKFIL